MRLLSKVVTAKAALIGVLLMSVATVAAAPITQSFTPNESLITGNIVSVDTESKTVYKTRPDKIQQMYGVVTEIGNIAFSGEEDAETVSVANNGIIPVLASTVSGDIASGDPVTVATIAGIGEKATRSGRIVGVAMEALNEATEQAQKTSVEVGGESREVILGVVLVKVGVGDYTPATSPIDQDDSENRNSLERIADNLAGKVVKPLGIIVAGLILLCGAFVATFLITSSSYSSMISIGRNPLAEKKVIKSLLGLILLAVGIFLVSTALAYLALQLLG